MTMKISSRSKVLVSLIALLVAVPLLLTACGVPQEDLDAAIAERDAAKTSLSTAQSQITSLQGEIDALEAAPPLTIAELAAAIRGGDIDVGTTSSLLTGDRFHNIHDAALGLDCTTCHMDAGMTTAQEVFSGQDVAPLSTAPSDKVGCLGCHRTAGPGQAWYTTD